MKTIHIRDVRAGAVVASPVVSKGVVLLEPGTVLTERYVQLLKRLNIKELQVTDAEPSPDPNACAAVETQGSIKKPPASETPLPDKPLIAQAGEEQDRLHIRKMLTEQLASNRFLQRSAMNTIDSALKITYMNVVQHLLEFDFVIDSLVSLYRKDERLLKHSLNVTVLSGLIGAAKRYNSHRLTELMIGALLSDLGMTYVPDTLYRKKDKLTKEERMIIENHTWDGFQMMQARPDIPHDSALCALQHHERYNGKGYPQRLQNAEIHEYAQIVAMSDVYDALVSTRYHRLQYTPSEAAEYLLASGNYFFDLELVKFFFQTIAIFPVASTVKLSSGQIGVVKQIHNGLGHRPVVWIIKEADGTPAVWPYEIDLEKEINLVIIDTL